MKGDRNLEILYKSIRKEVIKTGVKMINSNLVMGTWGNISVRIPETDLIAITPSGVDYEEIELENIVIMNIEGETIDGNMKPSIENPLHRAIYKNRTDVSSIIHTHSEFCTAMAIVRKPIPAAIEDLVQIVGGNVRVSEYRLPGTEELGVEVVKALQDRNAAILANHGAIVVGNTLKETLKTAFILEKSAKETIMARVLGDIVELSKNDVDFMREFYLTKYGQR